MTEEPKRFEYDGILHWPNLTMARAAGWRAVYSATVLIDAVAATRHVEDAVSSEIFPTHWDSNEVLRIAELCNASLAVKWRAADARFKFTAAGWYMTATSLMRPILRDQTGMPCKPDLFEVGQTVRIQVHYEAGKAPAPNFRPYLAARLHGVQFLGGFVRSTE